MNNGKLPKGWRMARFDELAQMVNERVDPSETEEDIYVGLEHLDPDSLTLRRWGTPGDVIGDKLQFRKGDIIFGRRRAYQRKLAVAEFDGICSAHAMVVRAKTETVDPDFLPFLMQSDMFMQRAIDISVGSLSPTINWKTLRIQEFPLPPKDEQRRIADILWAADESFEANRRVLENLMSLGDAKAVAAFSSMTEGLDSTGNTRPLSELADVRYGLTVDGTRRKLEKSLPYLRVANVQRGKLDLSEIKEIGVDDQDLEECALRKNDVLVVEGHADPTEIGRAAIWQGEIDDCLHQNHILRVRTSERLLPQYLLAFINSPKGKSHIRRFAKSSSGLYTINSTVLRDMQIPLQAIEHQQMVVDVIQAIHHRIAEVEQHLVNVTNLKNAIVSKSLGGIDVH